MILLKIAHGSISNRFSTISGIMHNVTPCKTTTNDKVEMISRFDEVQFKISKFWQATFLAFYFFHDWQFTRYVCSAFIFQCSMTSALTIQFNVHVCPRGSVGGHSIIKDRFLFPVTLQLFATSCTKSKVLQKIARVEILQGNPRFLAMRVGRNLGTYSPKLLKEAAKRE